MSFIGIVLSLVAHIISWTSPDLLYFAILGVPLQFISMGIMAWLYHKRVMPLQHQANLRWWHHTSSIVHGLMFLSVLSLAFHGIVFVLHISSFAMFMIRALSSIWLYTFTAGYGYASWSSRYGGRAGQNHRSRFQDQAHQSKTDIHARVKTTPRHTFGRYR